MEARGRYAWRSTSAQSKPAARSSSQRTSADVTAAGGIPGRSQTGSDQEPSSAASYTAASPALPSDAGLPTTARPGRRARADPKPATRAASSGEKERPARHSPSASTRGESVDPAPAVRRAGRPDDQFVSGGGERRPEALARSRSSREQRCRLGPAAPRLPGEEHHAAGRPIRGGRAHGEFAIAGEEDAGAQSCAPAERGRLKRRLTAPRAIGTAGEQVHRARTSLPRRPDRREPATYRHRRPVARVGPEVSGFQRARRAPRAVRPALVDPNRGPGALPARRRDERHAPVRGDDARGRLEDRHHAAHAHLFGRGGGFGAERQGARLRPGAVRPAREPVRADHHLRIPARGEEPALHGRHRPAERLAEQRTRRPHFLDLRPAGVALPEHEYRRRPATELRLEDEDLVRSRRPYRRTEAVLRRTGAHAATAPNTTPKVRLIILIPAPRFMEPVKPVELRTPRNDGNPPHLPWQAALRRRAPTPRSCNPAAIRADARTR